MRSVPQWIGKTDDQPVPDRVKLRVFTAFDGRCGHCTLKIGGKLLPAYDHIIALANGGRNAEANLQLLCVPCHKVKTRVDVKEKSTLARKRAKHLGIRKRKSRPMPGSRDSGIKMKIGGGWERR